jgi:tetratricopeptide (TPR) repeat protein
MKPLPILLLCAAISAGMVFLITAVRPGTETAAKAPAALAPDDLARLARSVEALEKKQAELQKALDDVQAELATRSANSARVPVGEIDAAVARALAARTETVTVSGKKGDTQVTSTKKLEARGVFEKMTGGTLTDEEMQALWKQAGEAGLTDELVAMFEERAKANPNDPKAQIDVGRAYLQKVYKSNGPEAGMWATKADKSFDRALTIDDHDWDARMYKAVSLSFWPPIMGKQQEALENFEMLAKQQEGQPSQPQFAQTHLLLGNMYQQIGDKAKALAAWKKGLELFPNNEALQKKVASAEAH